MAITNNPLDQFADPLIGNDLRIRPVPSLASLVQAHGLMEGIRRYDVEHEEWRADLERQVIQRMQTLVPATGKPT